MDRERDRLELPRLYERLMANFGPRRWWPVTPEAGGEPLYSGGPVSDTQRLEVILGAVLAQNTAWRGAARAVGNLYAAGLMDFSRLLETPVERLAPLLRPSGYFNQKAKKIKALVGAVHARHGLRWQALFQEPVAVLRPFLLAVNGIGPETADCIVLDAAGQPTFVIDAYTRRLLYRLGLASEKATYDQLKARFEAACAPDVNLYQEYHALLDRQCVVYCRKRDPLCGECPLADLCARKGVNPPVQPGRKMAQATLTTGERKR
ncbi:hypothetical protein LLH00_06530 [bacterium]|nr:hypothetical protein [bacterium]